MFPWIRAVSFTSLLICFKILYTLGWVMYVSCSKFVTNLSQESLCLLLTSLLVSAVFLLYSSLSSSEFSHFYIISSFFLLIVLFGHPIFLNTFSYIIPLFFLDFQLLLILVCFVSFPIPSQCLFHFPLYCLSAVSLFWCTAILCFHHLTIYFKKFFLLYWGRFVALV